MLDKILQVLKKYFENIEMSQIRCLLFKIDRNVFLTKKLNAEHALTFCMEILKMNSSKELIYELVEIFETDVVELLKYVYCDRQRILEFMDKEYVNNFGKK